MPETKNEMWEFIRIVLFIVFFPWSLVYFAAEALIRKRKRMTRARS